MFTSAQYLHLCFRLSVTKIEKINVNVQNKNIFLLSSMKKGLQQVFLTILQSLSVFVYMPNIRVDTHQMRRERWRDSAHLYLAAMPLPSCLCSRDALPPLRLHKLLHQRIFQPADLLSVPVRVLYGWHRHSLRQTPRLSLPDHKSWV